MAMDQAMLDLAERGTACLRLYRWHPFCLSFGRNEPALRRYDRAAIEVRGLDVVRRPTGGRAVWHAGELTYAVACPAASFGALPAAYRAIHQMLAVALRALGADARLAPTPSSGSSLDAGACFASAAGGEVVVAGRKVIGSAQLRQGTALLQHGSILLEGDQGVVASVTRGAPAAPSDGALGPLLGRRVDFAEAAAAVGRAAGAWPGNWTVLDDATSFVAAARAHEPRFRSLEWTWRR
jgi:lipoate-protein ligase A